MSKAKSLEGLSDADIADRWGPLKAKADAIGEEIEALKGEFDRRKLTVAAGLKFVVLKKEGGSKRLGVATIRAEMGEAWCKAREIWSARIFYVVSSISGEPPKRSSA